MKIKSEHFFEKLLTNEKNKNKIRTTKGEQTFEKKKGVMKMGIFNNKNNVIAYTVNKVANNNVYISVQNGEVVVKAPWYLTGNQIQTIVEEKKNWIVSKIKENEMINKYEENLKNEYQKTANVLGKEYSIVITYKNITKPELKLENDKISIILANKYKKMAKANIVKELINKMYEKLAKEELGYIFDEFRYEMGIAPEDYKIERMENCIAKCDKNDVITINPEIFQYNNETIKYIVLHQFCHLRFKNHTKSFYTLLEKYEPNYKSFDQKIKNVKI